MTTNSVSDATDSRCRLKGIHCDSVNECITHVSQLAATMLNGCCNMTQEEFQERVNIYSNKIKDFLIDGCNSEDEVKFITTTINNAVLGITRFAFLCSQFSKEKSEIYQILLFQSLVSFMSLRQIIEYINSGTITSEKGVQALLSKKGETLDMVGILMHLSSNIG